MANFIKLHVTGEFACFTRPEMKIERVSYDIITPSAARGILEAIYWKPQFEWVIEEIHLLAPIRFTSIRRNEISSKISAPSDAQLAGTAAPPTGIDIAADRVQRASLILRDVAYGIRATIRVRDHRFDPRGQELTTHENIGKHLGQFERRARKGGHFHQPYFGTREFPVRYTWIDQDQPFPQPDKPIPDSDLNKDLGFMLHDFAFDPSDAPSGTFIESNRGTRVKATPRFFPAKIENGIIDVKKCLANSPLSH